MARNMNNRNSDLEVVTFNVRSLHNFVKRKDVFDFLRNSKADILCLQELHVTSESEKLFKNQWGGRAWFSSNTSSSAGTGILVNNKTNCKLINVNTNKKGTAIIVLIETAGVQLTIVNIYGPPDNDDPAFFSEIFELVQCNNDDLVMFCGDWNMTMNPELDTYNYATRDRKPGTRRFLKEKCSQLNLYDVWRVMNENERQFSWRRSNPVKCARLDFFIVSEPILNRTTSCQIIPGYRSDHSRVSLRLNLSDQKRGKGLWKFNCSLLKDKNYLESINNVIQDVTHEYACSVYAESYLTNIQNRENIQTKINDALFLETLLMKVRSHTITYSITKKREKSENENSILRDLQILESLPNPSSVDKENIAEKQSELQTARTAENELDHGPVGMKREKEVRAIFSTWKKEILKVKLFLAWM